MRDYKLSGAGAERRQRTRLLHHLSHSKTINQTTMTGPNKVLSVAVPPKEPSAARSSTSRWVEPSHAYASP